MEFFCVRLPYLRPCLPLPFAKTLSPGLSTSAGAQFWQCGDMPWGTEAADAFLAQCRNLETHELETMRMSLDSVKTDIRFRAEMADIARFTGAEVCGNAFELARLQAQKALIWRWLLEEAAFEIAALEKACNEAEQRLCAAVREPEEDGQAAGSQPAPLDLPWRAVLANAAFFLPPELPVLVEGAMRADLLETLEFAPAALEIAGYELLEARAPLWQVLGLSPARGALAPAHNPERVWMALR